MDTLRGIADKLLSRSRSSEERKGMSAWPLPSLLPSTGCLHPDMYSSINKQAGQEQQTGKVFRLRGHGLRNDIIETLRNSFGWSSRVDISIRSYAENPYRPYNNPPFRFGHPPWARANFTAILEFSPLPKIFWDDKGKDEWDLAEQSGRKRPTQQGRWILDTHFMGFTPVHPKGEELNPKME